MISVPGFVAPQLSTSIGPGASSSIGLFTELGTPSIFREYVHPINPLAGPCRITNGTTGPVPFKESWNSNANIFFIDQPVGVGFSYADFGETVETTEYAAKNVHAFLTIFIETFSQFKGRPLHLAGESYGVWTSITETLAQIFNDGPTIFRDGTSPLSLVTCTIKIKSLEPKTGRSST